METPTAHRTVLLTEAVDALITDKNGFYIDGTFGRGGHSEQILGGLSEGGRLLAIDKDQQAVAIGSSRFASDSRFSICHGSFAQLKEWVAAENRLGSVAGLLLDLGVSSPQIDQPERGFSFLNDGPLDMRMNNQQGQTAAEWINTADESEIAQVLKDYGEEKFSRRMARAVVNERLNTPILTTAHFSKVITEANPSWEKGKHPATRAFQAVRIHINNELGDLADLLSQSLDLLAVGGRLVVISFHSLEDRQVKRFIHRHEKGDELPPGVPVTEDKLNKRMRRVGKAIKAGDEEVQSNPRARSAVMRVAEKIA